MGLSVWIPDTTIDKRIEHQQSCYEQEADNHNNLLASLIRLEVEHFRHTRSTRKAHPCDAAEDAGGLRMLLYVGRSRRALMRKGLIGDRSRQDIGTDATGPSRHCPLVSCQVA